MLETGVVGETGLGIVVESNLDVGVLELESLGEPYEPAQGGRPRSSRDRAQDRGARLTRLSA